MAAEHRSNIFCLDTDHALTRIYSGGNDDQVIVHDTQTTDLVDCFQHEEPVNGLSVHPEQPNLFLTACSDGRILMYDMRRPVKSEAIMITGCSYAFHSVQFNPVEHRLLVAANQKTGIGLYDVRKPRSTVLNYNSKSSMHARFNSSGTQIIGLRKRMPPILFNIDDLLPVCEFDNPQYYNSCTMKSCCFGGPKDQYVFSGKNIKFCIHTVETFLRGEGVRSGPLFSSILDTSEYYPFNLCLSNDIRVGTFALKQSPLTVSTSSQG